MLTPLIFVGIASDSRPTFVDVGFETADPSQHARGLLAEHHSCARIEVWREERCIAVVGRSAPDRMS